MPVRMRQYELISCYRTGPYTAGMAGGVSSREMLNLLMYQGQAYYQLHIFALLML
jgi:hypothetical protein